MIDFTNILQNNGLEHITQHASGVVIDAIGGAAVKTGVDFAYLVQQAAAESNFNPSVEAATSSATGLFQFIESTWMNMVEQYGAKYGIDMRQSKSDLLDLRKDPELASNMAAELAADNQNYLKREWGGEIGATELYFAHFLGAKGASDFLNARDENGSKRAAELFPSAARANKNVFYNEDGSSKTLNQVYAFFDAKFQGGDIKPKEIVTDNAIALAESTVEDMQSSPLQLTESQTKRAYNSLFQEQRSYNYSSPLPNYQMIQHPIELMILAELDVPGFRNKNSVF